MAIIELVDRDENARNQDVPEKKTEPSKNVTDNNTNN